MALERIQKILSRAGIASRRKAEELIQEGLVTINGKVAQLGDKGEWNKDAIKVKGKLLQKAENPVYLAFNKPRGVISSLSDPDNRSTLKDYLTKVKERVYPVGRMDFNSEGLMFLTNDGDFTEKLQKRDDIPRVYEVKIKGPVDREMISRIEKGARLGEGKKRLIKPHSVSLKEKLTSKSLLQVVMMGGGAYDLKSLFEVRGFLVERIVRTAIGHITLRSLAPGEFRYLKISQVESLLNQPELGMKMLQDAQEKAKPVPLKVELKSDAPIIRKASAKISTSAPGKSIAPSRTIRPASKTAKIQPLRILRKATSGRS
jgi:23S rRNA pseudouridine2605 synthase